MSDDRTPSPCAARRAICLRWLQLLDDLWYLEEAVKDAPIGAFTEDERHTALRGLGDVAWDGLANYRPRLRESPTARVRKPEPDLPDALRHAKPSERDVYRLIRAAAPEAVRPGHIFRAYRQQHGERTVYHALAFLVSVEVIRRVHPCSYVLS